MRILLLNKFTSPDPAPTARLLAELGTGLHARGWEVLSRSAGGNYRQGTGSGGFKRWMREGWAHVRLFVAGCLAPRPDVIFCLSDPPGLVFTASLISRIRRIPLAHWVMDVYPQIAAALGEVSPKSPPYRWLDKAVQLGLRRCELIGCLDEDMADALQLKTDPRLHLCPPWPPSTITAASIVSQPTVSQSPSSFTWLYSGNLGRAHDVETLLQTQHQLEAAGLEADLVFQGRGPQIPWAKHRAAELGLRRCRWLDYAPDEQLVSSLLRADVLVATQKVETQGLLWPSKLAVLKHLNRPILWIGPTEGGIARMLQKNHPRAGLFAPGDCQGVTAWLRNQMSGGSEPATVVSCPEWHGKLASIQTLAVDDWHQRLVQLVRSPRIIS